MTLLQRVFFLMEKRETGKTEILTQQNSLFASPLQKELVNFFFCSRCAPLNFRFHHLLGKEKSKDKIDLNTHAHFSQSSNSSSFFILFQGGNTGVIMLEFASVSPTSSFPMTQSFTGHGRVGSL